MPALIFCKPFYKSKHTRIQIQMMKRLKKK
ncbi:hypothetical protein PFFCH_03608 [Plasmodium falciparum FCH/4]|uniref:Uncharacterized protein n=1 Tax=Plasmodium falciparum FCH/4 TaxID=1036724 RepID=A0A024VKH8_PLAFA|nr:hypothetical protein PFFCH_03608 [Plasmodium falciparum FCH/4]